MKDVLKLIDTIYEAALDADKWPDLLDQAAAYFGARGAQIGNSDLVNARQSFSLVHGYDWSVEHIRRYEQLMAEDPRVQYFSANPFKPVHCRMALTDEQLRGSRIYKEVLSVGNVEYTLGVNFVEGDRALSYFLLLRDASMQPFSQGDCDKLEVLIPHLARALRLQREFDSMAFERQIGFSALDSMALGVLIVDGGGQVRFANLLGRRLLDRADGLAVREGVLRGKTEDGQELLSPIGTAIEARALKSIGASQAFRVKRSGSQDPYLVVMSSLHTPVGKLSSNGAGEGLAVLFVRDPDHAQETRTELLQRFYGLTGSEARLTDMVASGTSLKKGADALGLTEATARQYLKQVFRKTGTQRQSELVRKVLMLPPSVRLETGEDGGPGMPDS